MQRISALGDGLKLLYAMSLRSLGGSATLNEPLCKESRFFTIYCPPMSSNGLFSGGNFLLPSFSRSKPGDTFPFPLCFCLVNNLSESALLSLNHASIIVHHSVKMWILPLVGYMGMGLGFGFLTLAIGMSLLKIAWFEAYLVWNSFRTLLSL